MVDEDQNINQINLAWSLIECKDKTDDILFTSSKYCLINWCRFID